MAAGSMTELGHRPLIPLVSAREHLSGPAGAPVTLLEFGDFQCRHSGESFLVVKRLQEALPELQFAYRHFPIVSMHPRAVPAAETSEAAASQGRFWQYHDLLYRHQGELEDSDLAQYAAEVGLDVERFRRELASRTHRPLVDEDMLSGRESGVTGTPTFFINGRRYDGRIEYRNMFELLSKQMRASV